MNAESRRRAALALLSVAFALLLSYGCGSSSDYSGGGRRLYPPGGGDGSILETPDTAPPEDTSPPQDGNARDTNPPVDTGTRG